MNVRVLLCVLLGSALLAGCQAIASEAELSYHSDITTLTTACFPQGVKMETSPIEGIAWPKTGGSPLFGSILLGNSRHPMLIDSVDGEHQLVVNTGQMGEWTHIDWERTLVDGSFLANVPFEIQYEDEQTASYHAFLIWSPYMPTVITYCRGTYRSGEIALGDEIYSVAIVDEDSDGRYDDLPDGTLFIDADRDGQLLLTGDSHEIFSLAEPFNLAGTVYAVEAVHQDGSWIQVLRSDAEVDEKLPLLVGFPAPTFEGVDASGEPFSLSALRGSVIVLDFWASWCSPCIAELPTLEQIRKAFSSDGVLVVGINVDRSENDFRLAIEEHGISYPQIYDSDVGPIGDLYRVSGIPMTYIIDREGLIAARSLRGDNLVAAIEDLVLGEK